jgi:hypothetical protein
MASATAVAPLMPSGWLWVHAADSSYGRENEASRGWMLGGGVFEAVG